MNQHNQFLGLLKSYLDKTICDSDRHQFLTLAATGFYDDILVAQMSQDFLNGFAEETNEISPVIIQKMYQASATLLEAEFISATVNN